ncbi:hypothetical protein FRB94_014308, partial [Tulasnella sp. JGI-2019a]
MSIFNLYGLTRLHAIHIMLAFVAAMTSVPASGSLGYYEYTPFPPSFALEVDYARLHHIAPAVITLQSLSAAALFIIFCTDFHRRRGLPVIAELFSGVLCFALQLPSIILIFSAKPIHMEYLKGGSVNGAVGSTGKLGTLDAAAVIQAEWTLSAAFAITSLILLSLHMLWQLVVSIRHIRTRPYVFVEAVPGNLAWNLSPDLTAAETLPTSKKDLNVVS